MSIVNNNKSILVQVSSEKAKHISQALVLFNLQNLFSNNFSEIRQATSLPE